MEEAVAAAISIILSLFVLIVFDELYFILELPLIANNSTFFSLYSQSLFKQRNQK